ncbi:MAG: hypothetical protein KDJ65_01495 [Anaerolineae bacterium]|nr:hypothetical protein [Anaerolineae bacterium]
MHEKHKLEFIVVGILFIGCALGSAAFIVPDELRTALTGVVATFQWSANTVIVAAGIASVLGLIIAVGWLFTMLVYTWEAGQVKVQTRANEARLIEAEAGLTESRAYAERRKADHFPIIAQAGEQVYLVSDNVAKPLHLAPGPINGSPTLPTPGQVSRWQIYQLLANQANQNATGIASPQFEQPLIEVATNALDIMREMPHLWLVGKTRSGKTTQALHWLDLKGGDRYVIDPKPSGANPWPAAITAGHDGKESDAVELFQYFMNLAKARIDAGDLSSQPLVLLIDETYWIVDTMSAYTGKSARDTWGELHRMSTICAEYNIFLGITSTAPQVGSVGAEGRGGLLNNYSKFETVKQVQAGRSTYHLYHYPTATDAHNRVEVQSPGPYRGHGSARQYDPDDRKRTEAIRLLTDGVSERQVCLRLFGGDGGQQYEALRRLVGPTEPSVTGSAEAP